MESELKKLPQFGEGKEAQTSPHYLQGAIDMAREGIRRLYLEYRDREVLFNRTRLSIFVELEDRICSMMEGLGFRRMGDGDFNPSDGHDEMVITAFSPGIVVIMHLKLEHLDPENDLRITLRSIRMVSLN
jgi:hypothetical protein